MSELLESSEFQLICAQSLLFPMFGVGLISCAAPEEFHWHMNLSLCVWDLGSVSKVQHAGIVCILFAWMQGGFGISLGSRRLLAGVWIALGTKPRSLLPCPFQ